jgi:hypothetical protein
MTGSTLNIGKTEDLNRQNSLLDCQGVQTTIAVGTTGNLDYELTDDCYLTGIFFQTQNSNFSDTAALQVIDTTGIYSGTPGTVLGQFATNWVVGASSTGGNTVFLEAVYPAKIYAGMTLRIIYTSTGTGSGNVNVGANYLLHKCLY